MKHRDRKRQERARRNMGHYKSKCTHVIILKSQKQKEAPESAETYFKGN